MAAKTSIQVSVELKKELDRHKMNDRDTYEGVIWDLVEDHKLLNEETLKEIEQGRKDYRDGKSVSFDELKKKMKL